MQRLDSFSQFGSTITSLRCCATFIGCAPTERIAYRLAVLAFRCQHGLTPSYLSTELQRMSDLDSRRRLRSASTTALLVPRMQHSTIGDRAFHAAAARAWNSLPPAVTLSLSLPIFKRRLKTELFLCSYPDVLFHTY